MGTQVQRMYGYGHIIANYSTITKFNPKTKWTVQSYNITVI